MARTTLTINCQKINTTLHSLKAQLDPNCQLMMVVKANAYGLGMAELAQRLDLSPIHSFAVATVDEGQLLRSFVKDKTILLLCEPTEEDFSHILKDKLTPLVYSKHTIHALNEFCKRSQTHLELHLKCNTGMNRLGCRPKEAPELIQTINDASHLKLTGIMSHFSHSNNPDFISITKNQLQQFTTCIETLLPLIEKQNTGSPMLHIANSAASSQLKDSHLNCIRVGLSCYQNSLSLTGKLIHIQKITKGETVSYFGKYLAETDRYIGVIGTGYADGIPSTIQDRSPVLIAQKKYPIVGQVCMDMILVDLGETQPAFTHGETVEFFGTSANSISLETFSTYCKINPRAVLCGIGQRVKRRYLS